MAKGGPVDRDSGEPVRKLPSLIDRLREDDRITAIFIFGRGKEAKYYASFRNSAR
jgi:hypothetical protein